MISRMQLSQKARKLTREVGGIVLGVLIALGIGEIADGMRHRSSAREAMTAVRHEVAALGIPIEERLIKGRCVTRRIDVLRSELLRARRTGRLRSLGPVSRPPFRLLTSAAWTTLLNSGELRYLPREEANATIVYFETVTTYLDLQQKEQAIWGRLRALENRPGPVGDSLLSAMEVAIAEATELAAKLNLVARQQYRLQGSFGVATDYAFFVDTTRSGAIANALANPICLPLAVGDDS